MAADPDPKRDGERLVAYALVLLFAGWVFLICVEAHRTVKAIVGPGSCWSTDLGQPETYRRGDGLWCRLPEGVKP